MRKRKAVEILCIVAGVLMAGCGDVRDVAQMEEAAQMTEVGVDGEGTEKNAESGAGEAETADGQDKEMNPDMQSEEPDDGDEVSAQGEEMRKSSTILEDEQAVYICGEDSICRIDREEDSSEFLWQSREAGESVYLYSKGSGLLVGDRIYFIENLHSPDGGEEQSALSVIGTDGKGYRRLEKFGENTVTLFRQEDILYAGSYDSLNCYRIFSDGTLEEIEPEEADARYGIILNKYERMQYVYAGGGYLTLPESLETFGCFLVYNDDFQLVKVDPETGEETIVIPEGNVRAYNEEYLLSLAYEEEKTAVYLTDVVTLEKSLLAECENYADVINMDEDYAYIGREDRKEGQYIYERISLKDGECEELFAQDRMVGMGCAYTRYAFGQRIQNGSIYYAGEDEYKLYVMYRELENPDEEEMLGDAYYDSGISEVGTVELYEENIYSEVKPEILLTEISWERLVVDKRFPGAEKINSVLEEQERNLLEYAENSDNISYREEEIEAGNEGAGMQFSYGGNPAEVTSFGEKYISFCQQSYEYTGGAHGMPYWNGYTFDLQTGERLFLENLMENSEEELRDIVTKYFEELIAQAPDAYWPDALQTVRETTDLASDFYLTEEGIVFWFEPYALVAYAGGFQSVTIPYEEFTMKIVDGI